MQMEDQKARLVCGSSGFSVQNNTAGEWVGVRAWAVVSMSACGAAQAVAACRPCIGASRQWLAQPQLRSSAAKAQPLVNHSGPASSAPAQAECRRLASWRPPHAARSCSEASSAERLSRCQWPSTRRRPQTPRRRGRSRRRGSPTGTTWPAVQRRWECRVSGTSGSTTAGATRSRGGPTGAFWPAM